MNTIRDIRAKAEKNILDIAKDRKKIINYQPENYYEYYLVNDIQRNNNGNSKNRSRIDKRYMEKKYVEWIRMHKTKRKEVKESFVNK